MTAQRSVSNQTLARLEPLPARSRLAHNSALNTEKLECDFRFGLNASIDICVVVWAQCWWRGRPVPYSPVLILKRIPATFTSKLANRPVFRIPGSDQRSGHEGGNHNSHNEAPLRGWRCEVRKMHMPIRRLPAIDFCGISGR